ncbi:MAG TPA: NAD(P)-binding protein [Desulfurivibrionaceae bacterium]|nr:NAD(P)-binding protein [Desulfurivibrionaceae bacterium]
MSPLRPVTILGAGPAGLTAAITLAQAGWPVTVYERREAVGARGRGDLQGLENWSDAGDALDLFRSLGLAITFEATPFHELTVLAGEAGEHLFRCQRPAFYLVRRGKEPGCLDHGLAAQAQQCGVTIRCGETLEPEKADIVATGTLHRHHFAVAAGEIFRTDHPDLACGLLSDAAAEKGYAYLLVAGGHGCLCTVFFAGFDRIQAGYAAARQRLLARFPLTRKDPKPFGGAGGFLLANRFAEGNRLRVGEAAGLQDILWGFGMKSAVVSGHLAARSLIAGSDYASAAQARFAGRQRASLVNRYLWERFAGHDYQRFLRRIGRCRDPLAWLGSFYNLNRLHRMVYPFAVAALAGRYRLTPNGTTQDRKL